MASVQTSKRKSEEMNNEKNKRMKSMEKNFDLELTVTRNYMVPLILKSLNEKAHKVLVDRYEEYSKEIEKAWQTYQTTIRNYVVDVVWGKDLMVMYMGDLEKSLRRCFAKKTRHHSRVVVEVECYDEFDEKLGFKAHHFSYIADKFDELLRALYLDEEELCCQLPLKDVKGGKAENHHFPFGGKHQFKVTYNLALLDFLSCEDITVVNVFDKAKPCRFVDEDLFFQFRHKRMLQDGEGMDILNRQKFNFQYGYINSDSDEIRWPFKFSIAMEKRLDYFFQSFYRKRSDQGGALQYYLSQKIKNQWQKGTELDFSFDITTDIGEEGSFRYSKKVVEAVDRLHYLFDPYISMYHITIQKPTKQWELIQLKLEEMRALCIMCTKYLQKPFRSFMRIHGRVDDLSMHEKVSIIPFLYKELKHVVEYEVKPVQQILASYVDELKKLERENPSVYSALCNQTYFNTQPQFRSKLDVTPHKFTSKNYFVPMIMVYDSLFSIYYNEGNLDRLLEKVESFNKYFPLIDYPMEFEYDTGVPAFQTFRTVKMVFGMANSLEDMFFLAQTSCDVNGNPWSMINSMLNVKSLCFNFEAQTCWSSTMLCWLYSMQFGRVSFTGSIDPDTSTVDHLQMDNYEKENTALGNTKPVRMLYYDSVSKCYVNILRKVAKGPRYGECIRYQFNRLMTLMDIHHGMHARKIMFLENKKKIGISECDGISYSDADKFLNNAGHRAKVMMSFVKCFIISLDALVRRIIEIYYVKDGGTVGLDFSMGIGPRAAGDDKCKPPVEKVLELSGLDFAIGKVIDFFDELDFTFMKQNKTIKQSFYQYPLLTLFGNTMYYGDELKNFMCTMAKKWTTYEEFENLSNYPDHITSHLTASLDMKQIMELVEKGRVQMSLIQKIPAIKNVIASRFAFLDVVSKSISEETENDTLNNTEISQATLFQNSRYEMEEKFVNFMTAKLISLAEGNDKVESTLNGGHCNICAKQKLRFYICEKCNEGIMCDDCAFEIRKNHEIVCPYCRQSESYPVRTLLKRELRHLYRDGGLKVDVAKKGIRPRELCLPCSRKNISKYLPQRLLTLYSLFVNKNDVGFVRNLYRFTDADFPIFLQELEKKYSHFLGILHNDDNYTIDDIKNVIFSTTLHINNRTREGRYKLRDNLKESLNIKLIPSNEKKMEFKAKVSEGDTWARKDDPQKQVFLKYDHDNAKIVYDELFFPYRQNIDCPHGIMDDHELVSRIDGVHAREKQKKIVNPILTRDESILCDLLFRGCILNWGEVLTMCKVQRAEGNVRGKSLPSYPEGNGDIVGGFRSGENELALDKMPLYNILRQNMAYLRHVGDNEHMSISPIFLHNLNCQQKEHSNFKSFMDDHYFIASDKMTVKSLKAFICKSNNLPLDSEIELYWIRGRAVFDGTLRDIHNNINFSKEYRTVMKDGDEIGKFTHHFHRELTMQGIREHLPKKFEHKLFDDDIFHSVTYQFMPVAFKVIKAKGVSLSDEVLDAFPDTLKEQKQQLFHMLSKNLILKNSINTKIFEAYLLQNFVVNSNADIDLNEWVLCNNLLDEAMTRARVGFREFNWSNFTFHSIDLENSFHRVLADNQHEEYDEEVRDFEGEINWHHTSDAKSGAVLDNFIDDIRKEGCCTNREWHRLCVPPPCYSDKMYMNDLLVKLHCKEGKHNDSISLLLHISLENFLLFFEVKKT